MLDTFVMEISYHGVLLQVPADTKYVATDGDGGTYAFTNDKPEYNPKTETWCCYTNSFSLVDVHDHVPASTSLVEL